MYTSITIDNFRGFEHLELTDLKRVNLIAGKNNVGKTSLLEAIFFLAAEVNPELSLRVNSYRGIDKITIDSRVQTPWWDALFHNYNTMPEIRILSSWIRNGEIDEKEIKKGVQLTLISDPDVIRKEVPHELLVVNEATGNGGVDTSQSSSDKRRVFRLKPLPDPNARAYHLVADRNGIRGEPGPSAQYQSIFLSSNKRPSEDTKRFSDQISQGKRELLLEALKSVEPRLTNLELLQLGDESVVHGYIGIGRPIPINNLGDGIRRLLSILLAIGDAENGVVLIDEIENGLHYSVHQQLWTEVHKFAEQFNVQIFATTHSREMIQAAHRAFKERDEYDLKLIRLDRSRKTGQIVPAFYDEETLEGSVQLDYEVR